jgi:hypothetical protein
VLTSARRPRAPFVVRVPVDAYCVAGAWEAGSLSLGLLDGGVTRSSDRVAWRFDVGEEEFGIGVNPIKGIGRLLVLSEVSNDVCDDAFPIVPADGCVTGDPFDVEEYRGADSGVVDVVEASDGALD